MESPLAIRCSCQVPSSGLVNFSSRRFSKRVNKINPKIYGEHREIYMSCVILILKICKFCWLNIFSNINSKVDTKQPLKAMEIWQIASVFDPIPICQKSSTNAAEKASILTASTVLSCHHEMKWTIYEHLTLQFFGSQKPIYKAFFFITEITPLITFEAPETIVEL